MIKLKSILMMISLISIVSCIEEYKPILEVKDTGKYVVYGSITDQEEYQTINISTTSNTENPQYVPISGCDVIISDDLGNIFQLEELNPGEYRVWIDQEYLNVGISYKIDITTPSGIEISSDYDIMPNCADIDSVYYIREDISTTNPDKPIQGIQFYTNFSGSNHHSQYYKYTIEETWEYHARYPKMWLLEGHYFDEIFTEIDPPDYSTYTCWQTKMVPEVFVLSTNNLSENTYSKFPLHYVKSTTEKLAYGYSILIKQYALSEPAYYYWTKIKNNIINDGGLYGKQPELIKGNLFNLTNPNQEVLGYFFASSIKTKRTFIETIENLELTYTDMCDEHLLAKPALWAVPTYARPAYLICINGFPVYWLGVHCTDCTSLGGTTIKPDFWPINNNK